jgi:hypothetical protein
MKFYNLREQVVPDVAEGYGPVGIREHRLVVMVYPVRKTHEKPPVLSPSQFPKWAWNIA